MAAPDPSEQLSTNVENGSCNSYEGTNPAETSTNSIENAVKVRKPYTVTKQRENWSEAEHQSFLEAIKLFGRAWRQIQEHIGTKTAVQIRSHAQKFFSKVARVADNVSVKAVVIPPPRPKRKPARPYPRKSPVPYPQSPSSNLSPMERGTKSPTSILSVFASEDQINRCSSPNSCTSDVLSSIDKKNDYATSNEYCKEDAAIGSSPISSITLFGKIVLVAESGKPSSYRYYDDDLKSMADKTGPENHYSGIKKSTSHLDSRHVDTDLTLGVWETSCTGSNVFGSVKEISENLEKIAEPVNSTWKRLTSLEKQEPCYPPNGFRPYKRCLSDREVTSSLSLVTSGEEKSRRRARVYS